jgi:hypothetical protein
VTTESVFKILKNEEFNHYLYDDNDSGCRTWVTKLVMVLERKAILEQGSYESFLDFAKQARRMKVIGSLMKRKHVFMGESKRIFLVMRLTNPHPRLHSAQSCLYEQACSECFYNRI